MRQLTSELRLRLDQLGTGTVQETAEQLRHLGQSGEYILIPSLLRLMDDDSLVIRQAAEQAVARLIEACPVFELVWLNEHVREWRPSPVIWKRVVEREVLKIDQASTIRLSMLTMHWSGYIREAAVRRMIREDESYSFPYLLLRLNDWVSEIRQLARAALELKLKPEHARLWMENIMLVERLRICGRDQFESFIESVHHLLRQKECRFVLHNARVSPEPSIRQFAFRISLEAEGTDTSMIMEQALRDENPAIRRWAAQRVDRMLSGQKLREALLGMQLDSVPSIRREGLAVLATRYPDAAKPLIMARLLDPTLSVRDTPPRNPKRGLTRGYAEWYLDVIWGDDHHHLAAAISGLGETGDKADAEVVYEYAKHPSIAVRKAVIRGLMRLDASSYGTHFVHSLTSEQPGISREACRALMQHSYLIQPDEMAGLLLDPDALPHVVRNVLRIISSMSKWNQVGLLLQQLPAARHEWVKQAIQRQLYNWAKYPNRSYGGKLSTAERERLHKLLSLCGQELDSDLRHRLEWLMQ